MFKKLLVPLDRSPLAEQALGAAAAIARASGAEVDVVIVHQPVPYAGFKDAPWKAAQAKDEEKYIATIAAALASGASISVAHALLHGDVIEGICEHARQIAADLIVMTSHGRTGFSRAWLGSVADGMLRRSAIPVLMLRPAEPAVDRSAVQPLFQHFLVPLDGSLLASAILPTVVELARCSKGRLSLLRIVQPVPLVIPDRPAPSMYSTSLQDEPATQCLVDEASKQLSEHMQALADQGCDDVETRVVVAAHVAQAIIDFAEENKVDAIAMSTHGRGASRLLVGSVADKVLRASELPMLLRRPIGVNEEHDFISSAGIAQQLPALATA
jgi:nucleotide-binding universal stress UspA family protein